MTEEREQFWCAACCNAAGNSREFYKLIFRAEPGRTYECVKCGGSFTRTDAGESNAVNSCKLCRALPEVVKNQTPLGMRVAATMNTVRCLNCGVVVAGYQAMGNIVALWNKLND